MPVDRNLGTHKLLAACLEVCFAVTGGPVIGVPFVFGIVLVVVAGAPRVVASVGRGFGAIRSCVELDQLLFGGLQPPWPFGASVQDASRRTT